MITKPRLRTFRILAVYMVAVGAAVMLSFGGSKPDTIAEQNGSYTTIRTYGQPFAFHTTAVYYTSRGTVDTHAGTSYSGGNYAYLAADILFWTILMSALIRMAQRKPLIPKITMKRKTHHAAN